MRLDSVQSNVAGAASAPVIFAFTSHTPTPMADHACGPAAHAVPAKDVVLGSPSKDATLLKIRSWSTASEQAGRCRPLVMAEKSMGDVEQLWWGLCAVAAIILLIW